MIINEDHKGRRKVEFGNMDLEIDATPLDGSDEDILDKTLSASFNDETEPLMPTLESLTTINIENKDSRNKELNVRLTSALKKLDEFGKSVDSNLFIDNSINNKNNDFIETGQKLPGYIDDDAKDVILSAEDYIVKLEDQLGDLDIADEQIVKNTKRVMREIDDTYQDFLNKICLEINKKRNLMRLEAEVYKNESLGSLKACRQQINDQIGRSRNFISELSRTVVDTTIGKLQEYKITEASNFLGRIPAVPQPDELPFVTFCLPSKNVIDTIMGEISELGSILRMGPAQIIEIEEKPGSLFIKWHITDPEFPTEEQIFVIQKANGEVYDVASSAFETVYEGPEVSCFVKDLRVNDPVTLRVGLKSMETAWSFHRFAKTTISPYNWTLENKDYMVTNDGMVATKITDRTSTLFSKDSQIDENQIIEFTFLEASQDGKDNEGVALVIDASSVDDDLRKYGSLLITPLGKIFMDGEEKLMKLPKVRLGTRIIFAIRRRDDETLRINIESGEKAVTYDWAIETPLYFAARFHDFNKWNLMVK